MLTDDERNQVRQEALEEAVKAIQQYRFKCEFNAVGRSRGVPMLAPNAFKDQAAEAIRALIAR